MRFLFVDQILSLEPAEKITGLKHVTSHDLYWQPSQDGASKAFSSPIIGETLGQLAAWNAMSTLNFTHRPVAGVVDGVKILGEAKIGDTLFLEAFIDKLDDSQVIYHGKVSVNGKPILILDNALGPMLPMTEFIQQDEVKAQFAQIFREGPMPESPPYTLKACQPNVEVSVPFEYQSVDATNKSVSAAMLVSQSAPFFADHFPKNPVLPMTLLLKASLELGQELANQDEPAKPYLAREIKKVKMKSFVRPGDVVHLNARISNAQETSKECEFQFRVNQQKICVAKVTYSY